MENVSTLQAILKAKCPGCRKGDIYSYSNHQLHRFSKTNKNCPHCHIMFEREPGFYFGAMYISYVFSVAILLSSSFILYFGFNDPPYVVYIFSIPLVTLLLFPFSFRYSRVIYLYAFGGIRYKPSL